jgi:hypothetical protein
MDNVSPGVWRGRERGLCPTRDVRCLCTLSILYANSSDTIILQPSFPTRIADQLHVRLTGGKRCYSTS